MEVYDSLEKAVAQLGVNDPRRIYSVDRAQLQARGSSFVIAVSPSAAALAVVGDENVSLVTQKEKYNAALAMLAKK